MYVEACMKMSRDAGSNPAASTDAGSQLRLTNMKARQLILTSLSFLVHVLRFFHASSKRSQVISQDAPLRKLPSKRLNLAKRLRVTGYTPIVSCDRKPRKNKDETSWPKMGFYVETPAVIRNKNVCPVRLKVQSSAFNLLEFADQVDDNLANSRSADLLLLAIRVIPFLGDELSMPTQNRIGREDRSNFTEHLPAQDFAFDSQTTPLIIVEQDSLLAEFFFEHLVFGAQVFDCELLLAIDPTSEYEKIDLPRMESEIHLRLGDRRNLNDHRDASDCKPPPAGQPSYSRSVSSVETIMPIVTALIGIRFQPR